MKLCNNIAMFQLIAILSATISSILCNHLATNTRFPIENIDFSSVKFNKTSLTIYKNLPNNNEFSSTILFDKISVHKTQFTFNQFYDNLTVQFGKDSTSWILAKHCDSNQIDIFVSRDNEAIYSKNEFSNVQINDLFINSNQPEMIIFTDVLNKNLILSLDNGFNWDFIKTEFKPENVYFSKQTSDMIVHDETNKQLWISKDSGQNWYLITDSIEKLTSENLFEDIYFIEQKEDLKNLIKFNLRDYNTTHEITNYRTVLQEDIFDFTIETNYLFITKKGSESIELLISNDGNKFEKANFINPSNPDIITDYTVALVSAKEIFIAVTCEQSSDLFVSKISNHLLFELSLTDLDNKFVMQSLNKNKNVYAINAQLPNEPSSIRTFIKSSNEFKWQQAHFETGLNLKQLNFIDGDHGNSFSKEIYPKFMITTDLNESGIYTSEGQGTEWTKVLNANYYYAISNDEDSNLIVAVKKNELINSIVYSQDSGNSWNEYQFSIKYVFVNNLFIEPKKNSNKFILFCTKPNQKTKTIFTLDLKTIDSDYENIGGVDHIQDFDLSGQFDLETNNIKAKSFNLNLALYLTDSLKLNNYFIKVISYFDSNLLSGHGFETFDLDESVTSSQNVNSFNDIKTELSIKTIDNHIEVLDLKPKVEYHCYIYANLTSLNSNETKTVLLDKKIIIKTEAQLQLFSLKFIDSLFDYAVYLLIFLVICLPILICLVIRRKQAFDIESQLITPKYKQLVENRQQIYNASDLKSSLNIYVLDDNQLLIEKTDNH